MSGILQTAASWHPASSGNGLLTGLVSYYKLDEASGSALDAHSSNNLTENGTVGTTTGIINGARSSASTANYFSLSSPTALQNASVSVSFWVNFTGWNEYDSPVSLTNGFDWNNGFGFYRFGASFTVVWFVERYDTDKVHTGTLSTGVTYHIVGTFDNTSKVLNVYVDGTLANTATLTGISIDYTSTVMRMLYAGSGTSPNMWVDECGIWSRALDSDDVTAIYNAGACLPYGSYTS